MTDNLKKSIVKIKLILCLVMILSVANTHAQIDSVAYSILDKAMGFIYNQGSGAVYYKKIAQNLTEPMDIFELPLYQIDIGGHWFVDGDKFEINTAGNKSLCDGKLLTIIDEDTKTMYVDSIRQQPLIEHNEMDSLSFDEQVDNMFGEGFVEYLGEEKIKEVVCHKIKASFEKMDGDFVFYWVSKKANKLMLMAEFSESLFTVYEIDKVTDMPQNYNFKIDLPNSEMTDFHGFQVYDMRFANEFLQSTGE